MLFRQNLKGLSYKKHMRKTLIKLTPKKQLGFCMLIQVALAIRGFGICDFVYS
jgi:hypothetical protein